ncbi:MAG: hypothetical protein IT436_07840 [Phycisphaerales bacterium]|nr:hypothetical protein [Phycisphaerales bacterium]
MRYHDLHPVAKVFGALTALCIAAGTSQGQSTSAVHTTPPGTDRRPHNEQGRVAPDGGAKAPSVYVAKDFSLRLLTGGLGPCQSSIGSGRDGFDTQLYIVRQADNSVVKLDPSGRTTAFTDLSAVAPQGGCTWPSFDFVGRYGGSMYIQDPSVRTSNVSPTGSAAVFTINEAVESVGTMEFDRSGAFEGSLFLTDSASGTLYTVEPSGQMRPIAIGTGTGRGVAVSASPILGDSIFIADSATRTILAVGPDHIEGEPAELFSSLASTAPGLVPVALDVSKHGPFGRGVLLVADSTTGRIVQLDASGCRIGEIGGGFRDIVSVEIAWTGVFAGKMIITAGGNIYVVEPKCRADWSGDHTVTPTDLSDFMTDFSAGDADFDGNGWTDSDDLTGYFAAYSAGCP